MDISLKDKRILITAGPTWVSIDSVRVISNVATGETGILLARRLSRAGASVTLLLGGVAACCKDRSIKVLPFRFFDELRSSVIRELKRKKYDIAIHSAAVSDYRPAAKSRGKIRSGLRRLRLELVPTEKIVDIFKKVRPGLFTVGFKFLPQASRGKLIKEARSLMRRAGLELVIANTAKKDAYEAYLIGRDCVSGPLRTKREMTEKLVRVIGGGI